MSSQYSFEQWANRNLPEPPDASEQSEQADFSFPSDLSELEQSLPMDLDEGMAHYAAVQAEEQAAREAQAEAWARLAADYVLQHLNREQEPLRAEWEKLQGEREAFLKDGKKMARQIQALLEERQKLLKELEVRDEQLARYRPLFGKLYLKY